MVNNLNSLKILFIWTLLFGIVLQTHTVDGRPTVHYVNMTGDNSTTVDIQSKVMIVSVKNVPDKLDVEKFDREKGHIRLKAVYEATDAKASEKPSESDASNNEPV